MNEQKWQLVILTIAISIFLVKISCYPAVIRQHTQKTNYGPVAIKNLNDLKYECSEIEKIVSKNNVDLVVFIPNGRFNVPAIEFYNYGLPILEKESCHTTMSSYERRTYVFQQERDNARKTLLLYNPSIKKIEEYEAIVDCQIINRTPTMILIKNNDKNLWELSKIFKFDLKRNAYY